MSFTVSQSHRIKGNQEFEKCAESTNFQDKKRHLERAIALYYRAYETADNDDERSSAAKNYGTAASKLTEILRIINAKLPLIQFHYREATKYFSKALLFGELSGKGPEWMTELASAYGKSVHSAREQIRTFSYIQRLQEMEQLINAMSEDSQKAECYLIITEDLYAAGVAALAEKDYKAALKAFHDCHRPVEECRRLANSRSLDFLHRETAVKREEIVSALSIAESLQELAGGDELLKTATHGDETLNMDFVFDALDLYKQAAINTRELEVEVEAIAMCRLGGLYEKVLKIKSRALDYYRQSMNLALSLHPRTFNTEDWYKECTHAIQRYQRESVQAQEDERHAARQTFKRELEPELKELDKSDVGHNPTEFLKFLYEKYPPKRSQILKLSADVVSGVRAAVKKVLQQALLHYHPDKQDDKEHGLKWVVLCEEITRRLNKRFEGSKFEYATEEQSETNTTDTQREERETDETETQEESNNTEADTHQESNKEESGEDDEQADSDKDSEEATTDEEED